MTTPNPPFLYDDSRITYDEHCFYYDGGYDIICLQQPPTIEEKKTVGRSGAGRRKYRENRIKLKVNYYDLCCKVFEALQEGVGTFDINQEDCIKGYITIPRVEVRIASIGNKNIDAMKIFATEVKVPNKQTNESKIRINAQEIIIRKR